MSEDIQLDVSHAKQIIKNSLGHNCGFSSRSIVYSFTTENLTDYFNKIDFKDKKVLTVASSGDHALNSILYGAKEIQMFDINRLTNYYVDLKKAAISNLSYEEYLNFFMKQENSFDIKTYINIKQNLSKESRFFWDELFKIFTGKKIRDRLCSEACDSLLMQKNNPYMNEKDYYILKNKLNNIKLNFIESNIKTLPGKIKNSNYDIILLSNISDYLNSIYISRDKKQLEKYKKLVMSLSERLSDNGILVFAYLYKINSDHFDNCNVPSIYTNKHREETFNDPNIETICFRNVVGYKSNDAVMIKKKL